MIDRISEDLDRVKDAVKRAEVFIESVRSHLLDSEDTEAKRQMLQLLALCYNLDDLVEKVRARCQEMPPSPSRSMFSE